MTNITISLDQTEVMQVERVLLDADAQGALDFVRNALEPKIKATEHGHCHAWSDEEEKPY